MVQVTVADVPVMLVTLGEEMTGGLAVEKVRFDVGADDVPAELADVMS